MENELSLPPYFLYEGTMEAPTKVGDVLGYLLFEVAINAAKAIADTDKVPVMVHDAIGSMVTTVQPQ